MELKDEISGLFSLINEQLPKTASLKLGNIHGDLTFRNILISENQFSYIDFEHSEYSLPEFDYLMLRLDWEVYQHERVTYEKYFKILISYLEENILEDFIINARAIRIITENLRGKYFYFLYFVFWYIALIVICTMKPKKCY